VAFNYRQQQLFEQLVAASKGRSVLRLSKPSTSCTAAEDREQDRLVAVAALFEAAAALEDGASSGAIDQMTAALLEHAATAADRMPGLVTAAALALHSAADARSLHAFCLTDARAADTMRVLRALHGAFEACQLQDGLLRGSVAVRLGLLLEKQGQLSQARAIAGQAVAALEAARCEAASQQRGAAEEHLQWVSASRTQPSDAAAAALSSLSSTEQDLACLHADALSLHFRLELTDGCQEAAAKAAVRHAGALSASLKRDSQAAIFGARTAKQKREDEVRLESAGQLASNPAVSLLLVYRGEGGNLELKPASSY